MSNADHVTGRCQFLGSRTHPMPVLFSPALFPTARHVNFLLFILSQLAGVTSREQGLFCFCCVLSKRPVSNMQSILTEHLLDSDIKASTPLGSVVKHPGSRAPGPGCRHWSKERIYGRKFSENQSWTCFRTLIPAVWETEAGASQVQGPAWVT